MINGIEIRNFRTHKKQNVVFGPGVTTIVGESFDGKSTIIRALKWVSLNKPAGDKMINWDAQEARVRVTVDSKKVIRKKGKTNSYKLSGRKDPFKAFGSDVPEPIQQLFNMSSINFQTQHEPPFWFCETPGEVSRKLNSIVNLEIIDLTLSNIASEITTTKISIKIITKRLEEAQEKKKSLSYAKEMNNDLKRVETLQKDSKKLTTSTLLLTKLVVSAILIQKTRKNQREMVLLGLSAEKRAD